MKSLELINERIESTLKAEDKLKMELQLCFYKDEANCIKQDLEVLEILKEVVFERVGYYKIKGNSPKYRTITIRDNDDRFIKIELSEEEFEKLKQWLEVNE